MNEGIMMRKHLPVRTQVAIHGLIGATKLNGLDLETCLRQVIGCIAEPSVNRVAELLPWNLAIASAANDNSLS
jgi:transposase